MSTTVERRRKDRSAALKAIENPQFTNPKFWTQVDPDLLAEIEMAMAKAKTQAKKARLAALEKEAAELRAELGQ